jgi:hypothetical protein
MISNKKREEGYQQGKRIMTKEQGDEDQDQKDEDRNLQDQD